MSKRTPKNSKIEHNTHVILCWQSIFFKAIRGNGYRFVPKGGTFLTETISLLYLFLLINKVLLCCGGFSPTVPSQKNRISFHPQRWHVPYRNHHTCCEKLWFIWSLYPNLPQMGQTFWHGMLMPLHDSMPSFMNFGRILDLLELQMQVRRRLPENTVPWCSNFIPR